MSVPVLCKIVRPDIEQMLKVITDILQVFLTTSPFIQCAHLKRKQVPSGYYFKHSRRSIFLKEDK